MSDRPPNNVPAVEWRCRWDWCRDVLPSRPQLVQHLLDHVRTSTPVRRRDVKHFIRSREGVDLTNDSTMSFPLPSTQSSRDLPEASAPVSESQASQNASPNIGEKLLTDTLESHSPSLRESVLDTFAYHEAHSSDTPAVSPVPASPPMEELIHREGSSRRTSVVRKQMHSRSQPSSRGSSADVEMSLTQNVSEDGNTSEVHHISSATHATTSTSMAELSFEELQSQLESVNGLRRDGSGSATASTPYAVPADVSTSARPIEPPPQAWYQADPKALRRLARRKAASRKRRNVTGTDSTSTVQTHDESATSSESFSAALVSMNASPLSSPTEPYHEHASSIPRSQTGSPLTSSSNPFRSGALRLAAQDGAHTTVNLPRLRELSSPDQTLASYVDNTTYSHAPLQTQPFYRGLDNDDDISM